ncbi:MAG: UDP-N-acetylmuramoylalanine--D-glutamate ligase [Patescibacteria group bacterium]|nr:MAG: UDP-N-acetylmuramoylalanine--D-glutamate ligase [Patescibacteria group bacterium]
MHQLYDYINQLADKHIVILGLGREGISTYEFLRTYLPDTKLWLIDEKSLSDLGESWQKVENSDHAVEFSTHLEHEELLSTSGIIIFKTPGIPPHNKLIKQAKKLKANFTSNTDLFFALIDVINANLNNENKKITTIGVTGTKGKSTTTAIIHHVLSSAKAHSFLGGNIGVAPLSLVGSISDAAENNATEYPVFVVLELSCHQLNDMSHSPNYAVILDITPEHLDYYESFNQYVQAKSRICMFQSENDFAIFDSELYLPKKIAHLSDANQLTFSYKRNVNNNWITYKNEQIVDLDTIFLIGHHTITNALPAVIIAKHFSIPNQVIADALQTFKTLPHRLELVEQIKGVSYYNDSLSTTPVATIAAIESFKNNPIILIAGGFDRGLDYSDLAQTIIDHQIKHLILLPDTGEIILDEVKKRLENNMGELTYTQVTSMQQAVRIAKEAAEPGDIVLMSPASASFNLFENYQDRGNQFKKFVSLA